MEQNIVKEKSFLALLRGGAMHSSAKGWNSCVYDLSAATTFVRSSAPSLSQLTHRR